MERMAWLSSMKFKRVIFLRRTLSQKREGYSGLSDTALGDLFSDNVCLSEMGVIVFSDFLPEGRVLLCGIDFALLLLYSICLPSLLSPTVLLSQQR